MKFRHSGNSGDVVWALPTVKAMGGGEIYLELNKPARYAWPHPLGNVQLNQQMAECLLPLLRAQPYITKAEILTDQQCDVNLDDFRSRNFDFRMEHLIQMYFHTHKVWADASQPWLTCEPDPKYAGWIVVNRTQRYNNPYFSPAVWAMAFSKTERPIAFIGTEREWVFMRGVLPERTVAFLPANHLEIARMIKASHCYVSGQSLCATIADGLKHRRIMEVCPTSNNAGYWGGEGRNCYFPDEFIESVHEWCN